MEIDKIVDMLIGREEALEKVLALLRRYWREDKEQDDCHILLDKRYLLRPIQTKTQIKIIIIKTIKKCHELLFISIH